MISFKSRLAVITGAGSGIGRALALALAKEGASLALADINPETLAAVAEEAKAAGAPQIYQQTFDVVDESAWGAFAERVKTEIGMADLVFNNAGIARMGRFEHTSSEAFASVMDVNFWGVVYGTRAFLSQVKLRQGSFVNISSVFGLIGVPGNSHYCASKFGVRGFSESIRQEFAQFGVHVASVHPGGINTNIAKSAEFDEGAESREQMLKRVHEKGLVMPPAKAADIILAGVRKRKPRILVGNDAKLLSFIQRLIPASYPKVLGYILKREDDGAGAGYNPGDVIARLQKPSLRSRFTSWLIRRKFKNKYAAAAENGDVDVAEVRAGQGKMIIVRKMPKVSTEDVSIAREGLPDLKGQWQWPTAGNNDHTILYLHGGGYVFCDVSTHTNMTRRWAELAQARLFSVDYRLAPEHPYPAAVDDALAAYDWLLQQGISPEKIVVAGDSAGGGLSSALMLRLKSLGRPMPSGLLLLSPFTDLIGTGASLDANNDACAFFTGNMIRGFGHLYGGELALDTPEISPLYGDLSGFPKTRIYVGNTEVLEDDSLRFFAKAREAGVDAELHVWEDQPHVWPVLYPMMPEADLALHEMAEFSRACTRGDPVPTLEETV